MHPKDLGLELFEKTFIYSSSNHLVPVIGNHRNQLKRGLIRSIKPKRRVNAAIGDEECENSNQSGGSS